MMVWRHAVIVLVVLVASGCATGRSVGPADPLESLLAPPAWPEVATRDAPSLDAEMLARQIHTLVNTVRVEEGLEPLVWSDKLVPVAARHSRDMAESAFFGHTNLRGEDPCARARQAGLTCTSQVGPYVLEGIGENLFLTHRFWEYRVLQGTGEARAFEFDWKTQEEIAQQAVASWLQSRTHRANVLSPYYRAEAIGVVLGENQTVYVTQNFSCGVHLADAAALRTSKQ